MTAITAAVPARRRTATRHTIVRLGLLELRLGLWFWVIVLPVLAFVTFVVHRAVGDVDVAISLYARQGAIWFPFAQAAILVTTYRRVHVAAGRTRRTFIRASLVVATATGLGYALVLAAVALVERAVHHGFGWGARIADAQLADESSPAWLLLLDLAIPFVVANLSGLLVAIVNQRFGGWWTAVTLPLTVGPLLAVQQMSDGWFGARPIGWLSPYAGQIVMTVVVATAVCVAVALAYAAISRRTPVRTT